MITDKKRGRKPHAPLSKEEVFFIEKSFTVIGVKKISEILNVGTAIIYKEAGKMGLVKKHKNKSKKLAEKEKKFIIDNYSNLKISEIAQKLQTHEDKVRKVASVAGVTKQSKRFSNEEIAFIKNNYSKLGRNKIALKLNRSKSSIAEKAESLLLTKPQKEKWTKDELQILSQNKNLPVKELTKLINRTPSAIYNKKKVC